MNAQARTELEDLKKKADRYSGLFDDDRFQEWKKDKVDTVIPALERKAIELIADPLRVSEAQAAAQVVMQLNSVFEDVFSEMRHYAQETRRLLSS